MEEYIFYCNNSKVFTNIEKPRSSQEEVLTIIDFYLYNNKDIIIKPLYNSRFQTSEEENRLIYTNKLTDNQRHGILDAVEELEAGKGIPNDVVMDKFHKKYSHG